MFEIKMDDARYWKNCVDSIVSMIDEGTFHIAKEGISLKAMDPSGISMISFFIPNKAFSVYNVDKVATVGLNLANLSKILASSRQGEQLMMRDASNKFAMEFSGQNSKRRYKLPFIDIGKEVDKEPKIEFESFVDVRGDALKEILKDATLLSAYINFKADKGSFVVAATGDAGELEEEHMNNADAIKKLDAKKPTSATFNLEYMERMVSACPSTSLISLSLKNNEPIRIDYTIGDASVAYYLAPYMES